jgi:hypothetical protein
MKLTPPALASLTVQFCRGERRFRGQNVVESDRKGKVLWVTGNNFKKKVTKKKRKTEKGIEGACRHCPLW